MEKTAQAQADAVLKTEQGQRQERLKNAIEHLGHEKGLRAPRRGLRTLPSSKRHSGRRHRKVEPDSARYSLRPYPPDDGRKVNTGQAHKSKPSEEVQSLLTLLFVQKHEVFKGCHINLQGELAERS